MNSQDAQSVDDKDTLGTIENHQTQNGLQVQNNDKHQIKQKFDTRRSAKVRRETLQANQRQSAKNIINEEEANLRRKKKQSSDKYEYQLVGVLIHSGSADAGHYYSYIKERNKESPNYGKWFEFNDTIVKEFNIAHLKKECFGGQQQKHETNEFENEGAQNQNRLYERCCNAYLIFYERIAAIEAKTDMLLSEAEEIKKEAQQRQIFQKIHEQNQAFKHLKIFSENDFIKFMLEYVNLCSFQDVLYFPE